MREFSLPAVILGAVIGAMLAAANMYVGLKAGMTVSASIPAAVLSMAILRGVFRRGSILENNIAQTVGSAGSSLAAGLIFTVPAMFLMGQSPALLDIVVWASIGGLLGVAFMVPLRRVLIVREHGTLTYPEGVACAEVLESGARGGAGARKVWWGMGVAGLYQLFRGLGGWKGEVDVHVTVPQAGYRTAFQLEASPALLGVGFILGPRVAGYMLGGAVLGWYLLIPAIAYFGADAPVPVLPQTGAVIRDMPPQQLYTSYIKYIGAGAVAVGGLISLIKSSRTILSSMWGVMAGVFAWRRHERTDRDLPLPLLGLIIAALGYAMYALPHVRTGHVGAIAALIATFLFVTVSSRLVGLVGSSSNPISGMTIATLLGTSIVFVHFVGTDMTAKLGALSVAAVVCVAIGVAGDTSQDLKTGFLVQATPWKQQIGELIGVLTACVVAAYVLQLLASTYGFGDRTAEHPDRLMAPQATLMKVIIEGVMDGNLPWVLIISGGAVAVIVELLGVPALPVAVGLYLPLSLSTPIMVGGAVRWFIDLMRGPARERDATNPGVLTASGFVAGEGLVGIALAGVAALIGWHWHNPKWINPANGLDSNPVTVVPSHGAAWLWRRLGWDQWYNWNLAPEVWAWLPCAVFALLVLWLTVSGLRRVPLAITSGSTGYGPPPPAWRGGDPNRFTLLPDAGRRHDEPPEDKPPDAPP